MVIERDQLLRYLYAWNQNLTTYIDGFHAYEASKFGASVEDLCYAKGKRAGIRLIVQVIEHGTFVEVDSDNA